jgi:hypothetical protein
MPGALRNRFWLEIGIASACGALAAVTLLWRDWVEASTGLDPDHGSGSFEWMLVAGLALAGASIGWAARREWLRSRAAVASN